MRRAFDVRWSLVVNVNRMSSYLWRNLCSLFYLLYADSGYMSCTDRGCRIPSRPLLSSVMQEKKKGGNGARPVSTAPVDRHATETSTCTSTYVPTFQPRRTVESHDRTRITGHRSPVEVCRGQHAEKQKTPANRSTANFRRRQSPRAYSTCATGYREFAAIRTKSASVSRPTAVSTRPSLARRT